MRVGPLKLKLQLVCGDMFAFGPGKADLLDAIERDGSISAAGRTLGMSYRRTWVLVDEMNRCFREKLVETLTGGGKLRGARLTATGRAVLSAYRELEEQSARLVEGESYATLAGVLRDEPLPARVGREA